jgi:signal transduction histidine kinase
MGGVNAARGWLYPVAAWLVLLGVVFMAEYAVMQVLPWVLPEGTPSLLASAADAVALTLLLAPVLWGTQVRPLREAIRLRTRFLVDLFAQIESDRRQTAHELHDGVGQSLTLLVSGLRSLECGRATPDCAGRIQALQRLAQDSLWEVKRLASGLRPSLLDDLGLAPALERLAADVRAHHPLDLSLDVAGVAGVRLPERVATAAFRIVQEALANVMKHSRARHAAVTVRQADGRLTVEVTDDGCGIDPARLRAPPPGHLGLTGMRERAHVLGGRFAVESAPGRGTRVMADLPGEGVSHE